MKKKIFVTSLLGALAVLCLTFAFIGAGRSVKADAVLTNKNVVMEEKAAIRTHGPMGIRFTAKIKKSVRANATDCGMYICPADLLPEYGVFPVLKCELESKVMDEGAEHASTDKYIKKVSVGNEFFIEEPGSYDTMRVAIVDILPRNYDREFSAMAYVVDGDGNKTFSDAVATRCISDVAEAALADYPANGIVAGSPAESYLQGIVADSNDFVITGGGSTDEGVKKDGSFSHVISVDGPAVCRLDVKRKFRGASKAVVTLDAKASAEGITVCGQDIPADGFKTLEFIISGDVLNLGVAGTGNIYLDNIGVSAMKSLGVDGVALSGISDAGIRQADINVLPNGNIEYNSNSYGYNDVGLNVAAKEVSSDEYLAFRFKYNADMEGTDGYFVPNDEGFWFHGIGNHDGKWFSVFGDDLKDYTIYTAGENGTPHGSYHGTNGLTTKPDTWYYAVAQIPGNPGLIKHYYCHCHMEISGVYSVSEDLKNKLFVKKNYPGKDFVPLSGNDIKDLGLGVLKEATDSKITLADDGFFGYTDYSTGDAWGASRIEFDGLDGKMSAADYLVMKFKYSEDNGFADNANSEGLYFGLYYADNVNPYLQVFDEEGYDYTRYQEDGITPCGTYHNSLYSTEPGKWYYMLNRAGIPNKFETGLANQRCVIGGVYAISETVKNEKFEKGKRPVLLRVPYNSKVIGIGDALTPDITGISYNVNQNDLRYASDNPQIAEVSDQGVITGKGFGKCKITVSLESDPAKSAVMAITVTDLQVEGGSIREFSLKDLLLRGGNGSLTYDAPTDTAVYDSGAYTWGEAGFTTGEFVGADEYLVLKFRYKAEMEEEGTHYFTPDTYSNEGLWIMGYDYVKADGTDGSGHAKDYFSVFDEDYYDYTLYMRKDGDTSYEGNDLTVPYGSFHGTKGLTTKPDTWYYAVAPVKGGYRSITSCNPYLHIEIGAVYAVNRAVRDKFEAQHYPTYINLPYGEMRIVEGDEIIAGNKLTPDISGASVKSVTAENLRYESADTGVVTVTDGKIKGVAEGTCDITVSLSDNSCEPKNIRFTVLPGPEEFSDTNIPSNITSLSLDDLSVISENAELSVSANGRIYSAPDKNQRDARIIIGGERRIGAEEYLVFKFRYFDDMYFAENSYGNEGLWFLGFHKETDQYKDEKYFAIFDEDYYDYTIYKTDAVDFPYGSYHGTDGITTEPGIWYYAVAPVPGDWYCISSYFNGAHLEIAGIYAVAADKITSDDGALFKIGKGNYPGAITAPREMSVLTGEERDISGALILSMPDSDGPVTACSSSDAAIASVTDAGVITGVAEGECDITVTYRKASKRIKVHVLSVPEPAPLTGDGVRNIGTGCIAAGTGVCKTGNLAHFEAFESKAGRDDGHNLCSIALNANASADEYLVFKAMYTPGMKFKDRSGDEGIWLLGHRNDAVYNTSAYYDYFSVLGEDGTDYTIYNERNLPYGSYHNFSKDLTTMPYTWYYFVAPQKGGYTDFGSYLLDADMIIGGVYGISGTYYNANIIGKLDIPALICRLETADPSDSGKLSYSAPRERLYAAKGNEPNEFRFAAGTDIPADKYIRFEISYGEGTDFESLKFIGARGRTFYCFSLFGTDDDKKDYTLYRTGDVLEGACGAHNTAANTPYCLIAPLPGNFDWFALKGGAGEFRVIIKNAELIDEETRNTYVAIATNNSAVPQPSHSDGEPVIRFGVLADSHIPCPNPHSGGRSTQFANENFEIALNYFKDQNVDALLLNGDIVDVTTWDHTNDGTAGLAYNVMNGIMDKVWGGKHRPDAPAHVMYTLGNHEYYYYISPENIWTEWEKAGYTRWQSFEANGYTFISLDISTEPGTVDECTKNIIEKRLAAANAADPAKPIFVTLHIPPLETVLNNTWGPTDNDWINSMLEAYPQIVMFGSHTHYSTRHPQSINQNRATVINVGPGTYGCVPLFNPLYELDLTRTNDQRFYEDRIPFSYANESNEVVYSLDIKELTEYDENGKETATHYTSDDLVDGYNKLCAGLVVSVYAADDTQKPNKVEVERVNLRTGEKIGPDWSFTATNDKTRFVYTRDLMKAYYENLKPQLKAEECSVAWDEAGENIIFNLRPSNGNEAGMGDNIVDCYKVEILSGNETLYTKNYVSDYWLTSGYGKLENFKMFVKEANRGKALDFKITAVDAYGHLSNEITLHLNAKTS